MPKSILRACLFALAFLMAPAWADSADDPIKVKVQKNGDTVIIDLTTVVAATPQEVWDVLTDFDHMTQFLPNLEMSKVLEKNGDVSITVNGSQFRLVKPSAYQQAEGTGRLPVRVDYKLDEADAAAGTPARLTFGLGDYDKRKPLIIDPVLIWPWVSVPAILFRGHAYQHDDGRFEGKHVSHSLGGQRKRKFLDSQV